VQCKEGRDTESNGKTAKNKRVSNFLFILILIKIKPNVEPLRMEVTRGGKRKFPNGKRVPKFKIRGKNENPGEKRVMRGGKRKFPKFSLPTP
jgi:hypothetical protein